MFVVILDDWASLRFSLEWKLTFSETICAKHLAHFIWAADSRFLRDERPTDYSIWEIQPLSTALAASFPV
jgi:hypothetical protein